MAKLDDTVNLDLGEVVRRTLVELEEIDGDPPVGTYREAMHLLFPQLYQLRQKGWRIKNLYKVVRDSGFEIKRRTFYRYFNLEQTEYSLLHAPEVLEQPVKPAESVSSLRESDKSESGELPTDKSSARQVPSKRFWNQEEIKRDFNQF